ncbi:MAG: hypothetical protein COT00_01855 [Candidatus Omnitrophica bacterium CG07_land_8_20_14_0_80_50_8]|nr:MAG: hypothetical protein AUJ71_03445 [Candidatus Omnitrophica bacterium CG1_02_49_16]PIU40404.1 MAG: hypothetical protein COT00_01855 [Candidatus Omnitrophica bacterium CG07_land_8_20_14_0_80_50_8]
MRILVTGGSGMLGHVLVRALLTSHEVTGVSKNGNYDTRLCDLTNPEEVKKLFSGRRFDLVIHTAAYSDVDGCERNPKLAHESNALTTKYLAAACRPARVPFIYISTDYVFDGRQTALYSEKDLTCPINVYGMTKLEGEHYAADAPLSVIIRTSWLFGPGNPNNFVNAILARLRSEKAAKVLADQEDSPTYTRDLALAIQKIGQYAESFSKHNPGKEFHDTFQVCNAGVTTRFEMTREIKRILGLREVRVEKLDRLPSEHRPALRPRFASMSTAHYEFLFKTKLRRWQDSLKDYLSENN